MILSDKYEFIFLKTKKTAGTSIEVELSRLIESNAVVTPFGIPEEEHEPRNYKGFWNPISELLDPKVPTWQTVGDFLRRRRFYNHIPAHLLRHRVGQKKWNTYYKFCVERCHLTKTKSHINMKIFRGKCKGMEDYFRNGDFCRNDGIYSVDGKVIVDRIISFENLDRQLKEILETLCVKNFQGLKFKAKGKISTTEIEFDEAEVENLGKAFKNELETLEKCKGMGIYVE